MIKAFAVHNFRSFADTGPISLTALTCLVGRNSSGKSSVLHALMLLRQSTEYPALGARVPQLNLNGPLIEAGDYKDIVTGHDPDRPVGFVFDLELKPPDSRSPFHIPSSLVELDIPRPYEASRFRPSWRYFPHSSGDSSKRGITASVELQFLPQRPFGPTLSRLVVDLGALGKATFVRTSAGQRVQHWRTYLEGIPKTSIAMIFPRGSFLPYLDTRSTRSLKSSVRQFVSYAHLAFFDLAEFLAEVKMVGPFRTPPARRYSFTGFGAVDTGLSGQRAVDLLITERLLRQPGEHLRTAVSFWLNRLCLAKKIDVRSLANRSNIFELLISGAGGVPTANFADVGFGISQILPVLVQGFLVRRGGTLIVQQPELHLHPDAQAALADFFIYLASQGVNSIVETHSEYFLIRLRRRLAERAKPALIGLPHETASSRKSVSRRDVQVLYIDQGAGGGSISEMPIDQDFQFQNTPPGFMSEALDDRLALMKALTKRG